MLSQLCYIIVLALSAASVACGTDGPEDNSLALATAGPQEAQRPVASGADRTSSSAKTYQHPGGFTFEYPADWRVEEQSGFVRLIPPGSDTEAEHYRVITAPLSLRPTDPQFGTELDALFAATSFQRSGRTQPFTARGGPGAAFTYDGDDSQTGNPVRMRILAVSLGRQAVLVVGAGPRSPIDEREATLRDIAASLTVAQGAAARQSGGERSPLARQWADRLRGKKLTYMTSYSSGSSGGYSGRTVIVLGEDGSFSFHSSSSVSADSGGMTGSAGGVGSGEGRWRIYAQGDQAVLELRFSTGEVQQYELAYEEGTFLNGRRFYVTDP